MKKATRNSVTTNAGMTSSPCQDRPEEQVTSALRVAGIICREPHQQPVADTSRYCLAQHQSDCVAPAKTTRRL
jgi:hypothetical protein